MNIQELIDKRASAWEAMKSFLDAHTNESGTMTAEDAASYDRMEADFKDLDAQIKRQQRLDEAHNALMQPTSTPILDKPAGGSAEKTGRASDAYMTAFNSYLRGAIHNDISPLMQEGTAASGGYLVPEEYERKIIEDIADQNVIRSIAHVIRTNGDHNITVPLNHTAAQWLGEGESYALSTPTFNRIVLKAKKLGVIVPITEELLQDSFLNAESYINNDIVRAFADAEETGFCIGDGTDGPTGIFTENGGAVGVTTTGSAITADDIISLVYALRLAYRRNAKFLMNDATVAAIRKLKDGNGVYMWQPALVSGQPDKLLGYDLITTSHAPDIASGARVAAFGDFNYFWVGDRTGLSVQRLNERYADQGVIGFKAFERTDAKVVLPEAIQVLQMKA
jgi:HK97 family phage major capsid protein